MRRIQRLVVAVALALALAATVLAGGHQASAAPITCKGNQTATNDHGTFRCINNGGQDTGSVRPKGGNNNFSGPPN